MRVVTPVLVLLLLAAGATAQTAFSYQGALTEAGAPAEGTYDFRFQLYAGPTGGSSVATTTATGVAVADGVFATVVDFGATDWRRARWLGVEVRPSGGAYEALGPRTAVLAAPLALGLTALAIDPETAADGPNVIGGYSGNAVVPGMSSATIGGGGDPDRDGFALTNQVTGVSGTVAGGSGNTASTDAAVGGGIRNQATGRNAVVAGGSRNQATSISSTVSGGQGNVASDEITTIGGGIGNTADGLHSVIAGGHGNHAGLGIAHAAIGGGQYNTASGNGATIPGGRYNTALGDGATVGGGRGNRAEGVYATVAGGGGINEADGNTASQSYAAVAGGRSNTASGLYSTVLGGQGNRASGTLSAAAGRSAQALHDQAFVWSGGTGTSSTAVGQFLVDAPGGVGVGTNAPGGAVHVTYAGTASRPQLVLTETATTGDARLRLGNASNAAYWEIRGGGPSNGTLRLGHASGDVMALQSTGSPIVMANGASLTAGGAWTNASSLYLKHDFAPIDGDAVLATLGTLPIATWTYDAEPGVRHLGPTSQDFAAAFGLGGSDEAIATVDADGVALAALQALLARVEALEARVAAQDAEIERLRAGGE